jgi:rod shape-determining protein MreD
MSDRIPRVTIALTLLAALVLQLFELPYALAALRPLWVPLVLVYWAMVIPQPTGLLPAWIVGLLLDVLLGSVLGQHALGLTVMVFVTLQMRGILSLYPVWQEAVALTPVWLLYTFLMFWIDGATGHRADPLLLWMPLLTTGLCWPLVFAVLNNLRRRRSHDPAML